MGWVFLLLIVAVVVVAIMLPDESKITASILPNVVLKEDVTRAAPPLA